MLCGGRTHQLRQRRTCVRGRSALCAHLSLQLPLLLPSLLVVRALVVVAMLVAQSPLLAAQSAAASDPAVAVLATKRGKVVIRSTAQYQNLRNCDLFVDLGAQNRRIFTETTEDGRSAAVQEQVLDHALQTLLTNVKNVIRRLLADKTTLTVNIQSHRGMHRSVAMAEVLKEQCAAFAEVVVYHMAVHRWDWTYEQPPMSTEAPPKNGLVFRPEFRNAA